MAKKVKLGLYAEPGTGKSVFAFGAPNTFFITTDGNYEWLEDWGAKEEDHKQVFSWSEAKKVISDIITTNKYAKYETIVVDLLEDLFKWCVQEFVEKNNLQHVGDLGYGKGYDITRNDFFIEICKLINVDKNIILLMHGRTLILKDRRGVEYSKYTPTDKIPEKLLNSIEGRLRYFLRAFAISEETAQGNLIVNRYLSLSPDGTTEFGITRGLDSTKIPRYIPLDWKSFYNIITSPEYKVATNVTETPVTVNVETPKIVEKPQPLKVDTPKVEEKPVETLKVVETQVRVEEPKQEPSELEKLAGANIPTTEEDKPVKAIEPTPQPQVQEQPKPQTAAERLAALKARMKANQGK